MDVVACAGDLFHRQEIQPAEVRRVRTILESARVPVLIAPGNEDSLGPRSPYLQYGWPGNVKIFEEDRLTPFEVADGVTIWGGAQRMDRGGSSFLDGFRCDRKGINVGLFHASEEGGEQREPDLPPCVPFAEEQIARVGLDHVLAGHYQSPHLGRYHTYPGAALAHGFENGPTGCAVLVELDATGVTGRELVPLESTPLVGRELDVTGLTAREQVVAAARNAIAGTSGIVRLQLTGSIPHDLSLRCDDLEARLSSERAHVLVDGTLLALEFRNVGPLQDSSSVAGQFGLDVSSSDLPEDEMLRVLAIGLRALEGREDLDPLA